MAACACGCGQLSRAGRWKRGHNNRAPEARQRLKIAIGVWNADPRAHPLNVRLNRERAWNQPRLKADQSPTTLEIAWAAGVYEGEGSCSATRRTHLYRVQLSVSQKDPELLHRLRSLFGGSVYDVEYRKSRNIPRWCVSGARALGFALTVYPFLTARRQEQLRRAMGLYQQEAVNVEGADH